MLCGTVSQQEKQYLQHAYNKTTELWVEQLDRMSEVQFLLIGEAPQYGEQERYFYNPKSRLTWFFRHWVTPNISSATNADKTKLLEHLSDFGFLIVDLFPYAFNKQDTTINYQDHFKPSDFVNLFSHTYRWYLKPRLEAINIISGNRIGVALRYKRHMVLNRKLGNALREVGFVIANNDIGCVASSNIPLDQSALENAIMKSIRGPG